MTRKSIIEQKLEEWIENGDKYPSYYEKIYSIY